MNDDNKPEIWQMQSQLDIEGLERALSSEDSKIRQRAAAALRTMRNLKALPALRAAFEKEQDAPTRIIIASALEMLKDLTPKSNPEESISQASGHQLLVQKLNATDAEEVVEAARQLGELGNKLAVEPLILVFNDQKRSIQVRLAVAEALLKLESAPVEVALLANLRHTDWVIRRNGAAILGQLKAEWAIQPLARALNDPHPVVRRTALAALKHIGTPESRKALAQHIPTNSKPRPEQAGTKQTVSGIDVKRPGKPEEQNPSGMLRKLGTEQAEVDRSKIGTRPLDSSILEEHLKRANAAQPILDTQEIDDLNAVLNQTEEADQENDSPKAE